MPLLEANLQEEEAALQTLKTLVAKVDTDALIADQEEQSN